MPEPRTVVSLVSLKPFSASRSLIEADCESETEKRLAKKKRRNDLQADRQSIKLKLHLRCANF